MEDLLPKGCMSGFIPKTSFKIKDERKTFCYCRGISESILIEKCIPNGNKPRTAKVGAISTDQKLQNFQNMLMTFF